MSIYEQWNEIQESATRTAASNPRTAHLVDRDQPTEHLAALTARLPVDLGASGDGEAIAVNTRRFALVWQAIGGLILLVDADELTAPPLAAFAPSDSDACIIERCADKVRRRS
ncbi:hypothetical protein BIV57_17930 [Mangrovactinospora gilvigrisea]|uniref:Uncharacterized protein n=1 Tax=Mangrovactinospora gilvigrisea TaxID=1428644 RepID=A0A1J7BC01_9ACTN|nr:hypothetical protein [Mangrovactinospora gilvigrisea]OIV36117.1 hypothetical protein BIV57_17930 [Mangrovactinospora gilvigrisea]